MLGGVLLELVAEDVDDEAGELVVRVLVEDMILELVEEDADVELAEVVLEDALELEDEVVLLLEDAVLVVEDVDEELDEV